MIASVGVALVSVLLAWAIAAVVAFWIGAAFLLDDLRITAHRALRATAAAMWFPPATLLISSMIPAAVIAGALLIANATRIVTARAVPLNSVHRRRGHTGGMFRYPAWSRVFAHETVPVIAGAAGLQGAFVLIGTGFPLAGACVLSLSTAIWCWRGFSGGAIEAPEPLRPRRTMLSSVLTMLLAVGLSVVQFGGNSPERRGTFSSTARSVWAQMAHSAVPPAQTAAAPAQPAKRAVRLIVPAKDLVPGVVLRPDQPRPLAGFAVSLRRTGGISLVKPLEVPFTGEYHLFPSASGRVQPDSAVYSGTPLDALFLNTSGGTVETQAVQEFRPFIDFANCGTVRITLVNGERTLGSASMQLAGVSGGAELKPEIFGFEAGPEERLDFTVPEHVRGLQVRTIRVGFKIVDPTRPAQSAKIALKSFRFIPRA